MANYKSIFKFDQTFLKNAYNLYKQNTRNIDKSIILDYRTYVGRQNKVSGKLSGEFYLLGKYYFDLGINFDKKFKKNYDEYFLLEDKTICVFSVPIDVDIHYHLSVLYAIITDLEMDENNLLYQHDLINKKVLKHINELATNFYKKRYDGVLEIFNNSKQLILF